jgi:outer membrane protein, multidrug efflux system
MTKRLGIAAGVINLALAGCTMSPFYHRPELPVANAWPGETGTAAAAPIPASEIGWRDFFKDPQLQKLIETALVQNRDLRVAVLNVQAARAQYRIQRSDLFPTIKAVGAEAAQSIPANVLLPGVPGITTREYEVSIGFTAYEIDLFGRIRSLRRQALETYFGYVETRRAAQMTLVSEVAAQYLSWLAHRDLLQLTKNTFDVQQASLDLTQRRFQAGIANALDVAQAQTAVETARANLAQYTRQVQQDENALTLLVGAPLPAEPPRGPAFNEESFLAELTAGLPSDLLERRPDIRAAEHQLLGANANIGAARAAFFPSILLTSNYGTASTQLSGLFQSGSQAWVFNPSINLPIFAGGRNFANLTLANVEKKVEIANYEKSIQTAFREVADALAGKRTFDEQVAAQTALVAASSDSYKLSDMRFRAGVDNYLSVIVSQRALYAAQQDLISVKLLKMQNLVTLYKALGGGWAENSPTAAAPAQATMTPSPSSPFSTLPPSALVQPITISSSTASTAAPAVSNGVVPSTAAVAVSTGAAPAKP